MTQLDLLMPLVERDALLAAGALDPEAWRAALGAHVRALDPEIRAFEGLRLSDLDDPRLPAAPSVTYKDIIDVRGYPTGLGIGAGYRHYPERSAPVVERLAAHGYVCTGKVATTEVSIGTLIKVRNPLHPAVSAGGSSAGSGASVAAGFCDISVGTDSAGSARWPAVFCGAAALRVTPEPTLQTGVLPLSPSMDALGLIARTVADLDHLWYARELASALGRTRPTPQRPKPRFGFVAQAEAGRLHPMVRAALWKLRTALAAHHEVVSTTVSWWDARSAAWPLLLREAWDVHRGRNHAEYHPGTRHALQAGRTVSDAEYARLRARQEEAKAAALAQFADGPDVLVLPLDPDPADPVPDADRASTVPEDAGFTVAASFAGLPCLALPMAHDQDGAPIGVQLLARPGGEDALLAAGRAIEYLGRARGTGASRTTTTASVNEVTEHGIA